MNERKVSESARFSADFPLFIPHHCLGLVLGRTGGPKCADGLEASTHLKWDRIDRAKVGGRKEGSGRERDMMTGLRVTWWWKDRRWGLPSESIPE